MTIHYIRSHQVECTWLHPNPEVKLLWALPVLWSGTTWERNGVECIFFLPLPFVLLLFLFPLFFLLSYLPTYLFSFLLQLAFTYTPLFFSLVISFLLSRFLFISREKRREIEAEHGGKQVAKSMQYSLAHSPLYHILHVMTLFLK